MSKTLEFITLADGWVADQWRAKGSVVTLSEAQAKYENVVRNTPEAIESHAKARAKAKAMVEKDVKAKADAKAKAKAKTGARAKAKSDADGNAPRDKDTSGAK